MADETFLFTSESVCEGHPDKLSDKVSDSILDACLRVDPNAKVACETCCKTGFVMVFGEISMKGQVDYESVVRETVKEIGYDAVEKGLDYKTMDVRIELEEQSQEIAKGVHINKSVEEIAAGDQGHVFGYATNETTDMMPLSHALASRLAARLAEVRKDGTLSYLRPDGKTQVTVLYRMVNGIELKAVRVHTIVVSAQHSPDVSQEQLYADLKQHVIGPTIPSSLLDQDTKYYFNPSGSFIVGGPHGDAGLTGRKIIVDTYGGWGSHGGGAFSGKDSTKVDRSAAYMSRWAAKSLVASGICQRALVQVSYAIGIPQPISIYVNSYNTAPQATNKQLETIIRRNFDFRPGCIARELGLNSPIFSKTAAYGHFGRKGFPWESAKDLCHEVAWLSKEANGDDFFLPATDIRITEDQSNQ